MVLGVGDFGSGGYGGGGGSSYFSWGVPPAQQTFMNNYAQAQQANATAGEPPAPSFSPASGTSAGDLQSQLSYLMSLAALAGHDGSSSGLNYDVYSPQEVAQRGLAMSGATGSALDAQSNYINAQRGYLGEQAGFIGKQSAANTLKNQLAGQDLGAQRDAAKLTAEQQRHSAKGQFAANGSITSDAARQALGGGDNFWNTGNRMPWIPDSKGDIYRNRDNTLAGLYRQLVGVNSDYNIAQGGLYNQLYGLNTQGVGLDTQQAQLAPQYLENSQISETLNRVLNGQYNTNVTPENAALMSALSQALYRTKIL